MFFIGELIFDYNACMVVLSVYTHSFAAYVIPDLDSLHEILGTQDYQTLQYCELGDVERAPH